MPKRSVTMNRNTQVVAIEGESFRLKEAKARAALKAEQRRQAKPKAGKS